MKKFLVGATIAACALLAAAPAQASALEVQYFTATGLGTSPSTAIAGGTTNAYGKATQAGFQRTQCYVHSSTATPSSVPGTWFGTVTLFCQR